MSWEAVVAAEGSARHGIVVWSNLRDLAVPESVRRNLRREGRLVPVGRGVDKLRDHPWTFEARCAAGLALAGPGAALAGRTAARIHGFYRYRDNDEVEVIVSRGVDHRTAVGRVLQTGWLPTSHLQEFVGMPITTPARTFFDLCGRPDWRMKVDHPVHERHMRAVYDDCIARRGVTFALEAAVLVVMAKRGRSGTRLVRQILLSSGEGYVPTESDAERLFVELLEAYELPPAERQVDISGSRGWIGRVDFVWPAAMHIVEVDSTFHDSEMEKRADAERDEELAAAGYTVRRVRYDEIVGRPGALARELGGVVAT